MDTQLKPRLCEVLVRYGAETGTHLNERVALALAQLEVALAETSSDGASLSALDVVRIRLGKLAAVVLPAALFRDAAQLARLRAELHELARSALSRDDGVGSRFSRDP